MAKPNNKQLKKALTAAEKAAKAFADKRLTAYFGIPEIKEKSWHEFAVAYSVDFTIDMANALKTYQKKLTKLIQNNTMFVSDKPEEKQPIEKADTTDYLDSEYNRIIDPTIKDILATMEAEFLEICRNIYIERMEKLSLTAADAVLKDMGLKINFNKVGQEAKNHIKAKRIRWADLVNQTTQKAVKKALVDGFSQGLAEMDIAKLIEKNTDFTYARAESIARTETMEACNYADDLVFSMNDDILSKQWVTAKDDRVRTTHRAANEQIVEKNQPFIVGGHMMMYPLDGSMGAPAKEIIGCRCIMIPIFKAKEG